MITLLTAGPPAFTAEGVEPLDVYDIDALEPACRLLLIGMHADQVFLESRREVLDAFLARGGTLVIGGHLLRQVFTGAPRWRRAESTAQADLVVLGVHAHPVWEGVDPRDLSSRRGVSGFYGRGGYPDLPEGATIINRIQYMPVDVELRTGGGRVLLHGGNDLWTYRSEGNTAERLLPQLLRWGTEGWT
ncbi:hypothetical protein IDM40_17180 [Nocardiopsis sp. HNM0947]|uniref:ThuA-like domain-containing protein n=1 Tax=Nocardiopsis coralli TaxID=2772213 RepID=A0ABR9P9A2_9ACTN|nr:hypothetical protein [Nocardiopsis coralli]MBE3000420.1 hypothetical protein [Nocardiopsis coralli]